MTDNITTHTPLHLVAEVFAGVVFRAAVEDAGDQAEGLLIQMSDFSQGRTVDAENLTPVRLDGVHARQILQPDDILLRLRGPQFTAWLLSQLFSLPVITNNQVAIIRVDKSKVDAYYLLWFINSQCSKRYFPACVEGSNIARLSIRDVEQILLQLPPLSEQQRIGNIHRNWLQQRDHYQRLIATGEPYYDAICQRYLHSLSSNTVSTRTVSAKTVSANTSKLRA
ncbi:MAG: restriction endonuclease subunit S [Marinobacterium sp.]|nr:restriction endonuclease subunit S [Marinobacterium sp.]